mmetsp:Transcript_11129/g.9864  ORF Transcript_11129/g.9864 Transcript_11129/m.9864 type:complete len:210 (-) Transcript_11129:20-649(-)
MGLLQAVIKVALCIILLKLMKQNIHSYYTERKRAIILVTLGTVFIFGFKVYYNIYLTTSEYDFTTMFNGRGTDKEIIFSAPMLIVSFSVSLMELIVELILLKTNIDNVNYKGDLQVLRKSCGLSGNHSTASIFIINSKSRLFSSYYQDSRVRGPTLDTEGRSLIETRDELWEETESSEEDNPDKFREGFDKIIKINSVSERKLLSSHIS